MNGHVLANHVGGLLAILESIVIRIPVEKYALEIREDQGRAHWRRFIVAIFEADSTNFQKMPERRKIRPTAMYLTECINRKGKLRKILLCKRLIKS